MDINLTKVTNSTILIFNTHIIRFSRSHTRFDIQDEDLSQKKLLSVTEPSLKAYRVLPYVPRILNDLKQKTRPLLYSRVHSTIPVLFC